MPFLKIENLKKLYSEKLIFENINFKAKKGEFITLLGPSGCGKSTLLRCICGLSGIEKGKIILDGKDITKTPVQKRHIGMVFQNYALFPNLTVFDNIAYGLKIKKQNKKDIKKNVKKMLELVDLQDFEKSYPHNLSGGQMQRVALARSLVTSPSLLLLDEPLSALDAKIRKYLREEIRNIQKSLNLTTIFVTHDQEEALVMSDRIIIMKDGKIEQDSPAKDLHLTPSSKFVASFIGNYNVLSPQTLSMLIEHDFTDDVAIRPETIQITKNSGARGVIKNRILLGNIIRYTILANGVELKVDTLNYSSESFYNIDEEVHIELNYSMIHSLKKQNLH